VFYSWLRENRLLLNSKFAADGKIEACQIETTAIFRAHFLN
jgi:hypothetical protein